MNLSLCMIVKNEEKNLDRALSSVFSVIDEIIIVDTGSTDNTKEIASKYTDKIYDFKWINDFSAARNYSFSKATMDYIMWLDADDILLPDDAVKLKKLKNTLPINVDAVMLSYNTGFDENGNVNFSYKRERIVARRCNFLWNEPVHEYIAMGGNVISEDIAITHTKHKHVLSKRNLNIYNEVIKQGKRLSDRAQFYYSRELKDHGKFKKAITNYKKFLYEREGWIEDNITACMDLYRCYKAIGNSELAFKYLYKSFEYDLPRAEACCELGYKFKAVQNYRVAAFWFNLALTGNNNYLGFVNHDFHGFIPCIELVVCYDQMGDHSLAERYNQHAETLKPNSSACEYNRKYFEEIRKSKEYTGG